MQQQQQKSDAGEDLENFEFVDQVGFILDEGGAVERLAGARHALGQFLANSDRIARAGPNLNKRIGLSFSKICKISTNSKVIALVHAK